MNQQSYAMGKAAYQGGDWLVAATSLETALEPGEVNGEVYHLVGNSYMRLGRFDDAARAYRNALADTSYGKVGALSCNLGRALLAAGRPEEAVSALSGATRDESYKSAYKAYVALGTAYEQLGDVRNAGIAYRNAAIDDANPNPAPALSSLGSCFMRLGRPVDAVEAYRTALDFSTTAAEQNAVYRDLGLAYVAANRMAEAVDAFGHATADGTLKLTPETQATYDAARRAVAAINAKRPSDTDALLANAGYGTGSYDPLDPTGESGELMPSPEDTGFFEISEEDIVAEDRKNRKGKGRRHTGLRVFLVILIILLLVAAAGGYAYYRGYGWPSQSSVVSELFSTAGTDAVGEYLSDSISDAKAASIESILPEGATVEVKGLDQEMTRSVAYVTATLSTGGTQDYTVTLVRDGLGWAVSDVEAEYASEDGATTLSTTTTTVGTVSDGTEATTDATATTDGTGDVTTDTTTTDGATADATATDGATADDAAATTDATDTTDTTTEGTDAADATATE